MSPDDLVQRMVERGLWVPDQERACRYLQHIGYYRLSPYAIPFQHGGSEHLFRAGTSFDDLLGLYVFDRSLRLLVMDALERVEVAVRAALTDHMAMTTGNAHWYLDPQHFHDPDRHRRFLRMVRTACEEQLRRSPARDQDRLHHPSALDHYLEVYGEPELPPSWVMAETLTLGQLSGLYRNLALPAHRKAVAQSVGLKEPLLTSWLETYVRLRNICAHHGRLWNVGLGVYPKIPRSSDVPWLHGDDALPQGTVHRLYPVLVSLQTVLETISPRSSWAKRLHQLLQGRGDLVLRGMGVPEAWAGDEFWARHLRG